MRFMISPLQIRAARALLELKRADLAASAGISSTALANIERSESDPRASTLQKIQEVLETEGIVFGENDGVSLTRRN